MASFSLVALLTPLFSAVMILHAASLLRRRHQSWREFVLWALVWLGIAGVALRPDLLDVLPPYVGIRSGVNLLVFFGFVVLFYGFFRLFAKVEQLEHKMVQMSRQAALRQAKSDSPDGAEE